MDINTEVEDRIQLQNRMNISQKEKIKPCFLTLCRGYIFKDLKKNNKIK